MVILDRLQYIWLFDFDLHDAVVRRFIQNIVLRTLLTKIKHKYKQANLTTILQSTMFESGKFEVNDFGSIYPWHIFK